MSVCVAISHNVAQAQAYSGPPSYLRSQKGKADDDSLDSASTTDDDDGGDAMSVTASSHQQGSRRVGAVIDERGYAVPITHANSAEK